MSGRFTTISATLASPPFARYTAGNSISLIGTWVQRTAVGWFAWDLTHSPGWVGGIAFFDLFATVLIGPIGGVVADRYDRRHLMLMAQTALSITALVTGLLITMGVLGIGGLAALAALQGGIVGINQPARLAFVSSLVPRAQLPTAIAVNSVMFNSARFIGPVVASLIISGFGMAAAFYANAASYISFIIVLATLQVAETTLERRTSRWTTDFTEGLMHVARHRALGPLLLSFIVSSLLVRPLTELLPPLAAEVFNGDVHTLAWLSGALGLGAVVGGLWIAGTAAEVLLRTCLLAMLLGAVAVAATVMSPNLPSALLALTVGGFFLVSAGVSAQTLVQLHAPSSLRGRVLSLFGLVFRGGPALGALLLGLSADGIGMRLTFMTSCGLFLVFWLWLYRQRQRLARALQRDAESN